MIAATNKNIYKAVTEGDFREDLFYRLNVFPIALPRLADRGDDVIWIANALITDLNTALGTKIAPIDPRGLIATALRSYDWPGNVRELRNVLERAMILSPGREIQLSDLPAPINPAMDIGPAPPAHVDSAKGIGAPQPPVIEFTDNPTMTLQQIEDKYIERVLRSMGGSKRKASQVLGIDLTTLYRRLKNKRGE